MAVSRDDWAKFVASRRTTRDFLDTPVPQELIDELLRDAMTAPSWSNTRPYLVGIATGEKRDQISRDLLARWDAAAKALRGGTWGKIKLFFTRFGLPKSDYRVFRPYPKELIPRQQRVGSELYGMLGIKRDDHVARQAQWAPNKFKSSYNCFLLLCFSFPILFSIQIPNPSKLNKCIAGIKNT